MVPGCGRVCACTSSASTSHGASASPPAWRCWTTAAALVHVSAAGGDEEIRRARAVRRGRLRRRDRRPADRPQRHRQPAGRGRAQPRLRPLRRGRPPRQHGQAGVQRPRGAPGSAQARPRHEPALGARASRDRGLPAPGDRGAVRPRADAEVQEQAGSLRGPAARRAARPDGAARGPGHRRAACWSGTAPGAPAPRRGRRSWRRPSGRPGRASCGWSRTRWTRSSARTSRCSPPASPDGRRRTATSRPATSSRRRCPRGSSRRPRAARSPGRGPGARGRPGVRRPARRAARGQRPLRPAGHHDPRRRRHQLPQRDRAGQERGVVRGEGRAHPDGRPVFADPLQEITDTIGLRIITYVHSDVAAVADLLGDQVVSARRP